MKLYCRAKGKTKQQLFPLLTKKDEIFTSNLCRVLTTLCMVVIKGIVVNIYALLCIYALPFPLAACTVRNIIWSTAKLLARFGANHRNSHQWFNITGKEQDGLSHFQSMTILVASAVSAKYSPHIGTTRRCISNRVAKLHSTQFLFPQKVAWGINSVT